MNTRQLLVNREFNTANYPHYRDNWYASLAMLRQYKSLEYIGFYDTTSSAGDWEGYIVQRIKDKRYLILFSQVNNYPHAGFTVYTNKPIITWNNEHYTRNIVESMIAEYIDCLHGFK